MPKKTTQKKYHTKKESIPNITKKNTTRQKKRHTHHLCYPYRTFRAGQNPKPFLLEKSHRKISAKLKDSFKKNLPYNYPNDAT